MQKKLTTPSMGFKGHVYPPFTVQKAGQAVIRLQDYFTKEEGM